MDIVVADFQIKLLLAEQNQIGQFQGVDAQVVDQFGAQGDIVGVHGQFFNQKLFYFLKHTVLLLPQSGLFVLVYRLRGYYHYYKMPEYVCQGFFRRTNIALDIVQKICPCILQRMGK